MNRDKLAQKAEYILRASKGQSTPLSEETQQACVVHAKIKAHIYTELLPSTGPYCGIVSVLAERSLECAMDIQLQTPSGVLVFCSATRPGGGWLTGAMAQEEAVSRASTWALSCHNSQFYSDEGNDGYFYKNAVLSTPGKIFERNNIPLLMPAPVHFVGMCAPNARAMEEHHQHPKSPAVRKKITDSLVFRMRMSLQAFAQSGCQAVVLGAVGCGVFQVQVEDCVKAWERALRLDGAPFKHVAFGLGLNPSDNMTNAFSALTHAFVSDTAASSPSMV